MRDNPKRATYLFLQLTLTFSAVVWVFVIWSGHLAMGFGLMVPAIMWCPAISALLSCRLLGRKFRRLAWHWPNGIYLAIAYCLPIAYASLAYGVVLASRLGAWNSEFIRVVAEDFGLHGLPAWGSLTLYILSMATGGVVLNLSMALGEEIGWRGFLVPELAKQMSFTKVSLVSGIVWAAWHSPLVLLTDYNSGTNRWYALACSSLTVIAISFSSAWLRLTSKSIWPPALLHASHNVYVPGIFDHLIRNTGPTLWYTTQFGAALTVSGLLVAFYFWTRRNEIQSPTTKRASQASGALERVLKGEVTSRNSNAPSLLRSPVNTNAAS